MIAVKLKKLWKPAEIFQKCSLCFDQSQQRLQHACKLHFAFCDAVLWFVILFSWLLVYNVDVPAKGRVYNQGRVFSSYISQA